MISIEDVTTANKNLKLKLYNIFGKATVLKPALYQSISHEIEKWDCCDIKWSERSFRSKKINLAIFGQNMCYSIGSRSDSHVVLKYWKIEKGEKCIWQEN